MKQKAPHNFQHLLVPIFLMILMSCQNQPRSKDLKTTIVTGKVVNYEKYSRTKIVTLSSFENGSDLLEIETRILEDGTFSLEFMIASSKQYYLKPFANTYIYVNPGDSVNILVDPSKPSQTKFTGDSRMDNENLNLFYTGAHFAPFRVTMDELTNMEPMEFIAFSDSLKRVNLNKLQRFDEKVDLSRDLHASFEALVHNDNYTRLFRYGLSRCSVLNQPKNIELKLEDDYHYYHGLMDSLNRDAKILMRHSSIDMVLDSYLLYLLAYHLQLQTFRNQDSSVPKRMLMEISESVNEPVLKEALTYRYFLHLMEQYEFEVIEENFAMIVDNLQSEDLRASMKQRYLKQKEESVSMKPLVNHSLEDLLIDTSLDANISADLGKIQFIDFWTYWCKPCLADMIDSKQQVRELTEKGNISITYVTLDTESARIFLEREEIGGKHLFLSSDKFSSIMNAFGNSAFPFQILIGANGQIVAKGNQYRLTSSVTKKIMNQLIQEM